MFAEVRETDIPLIELGRREVKARGLTTITEEDIAEWADGMAETLDCFNVGDIVVHLDGNYWTIDSENLDFEGYFAHHQLDRLPHADALKDLDSLDAMLGDPRYWLDRELPDRERD